MTRTITGRHVLLAMLGFFGLVIAVNATFIYLALDTFTGLDRPNAYLRGLAHNQELAAAERQRARGWQVSVSERPVADGVEIEATLADRTGAPLKGLAVSAELRRPVQASLDRSVALVEQRPGLYRATVALPAAGNWALQLLAEREGEPPHRLEKRLWLP